MHVISRKALVEFASTHPRAGAALEAWYRIVSVGSFQHFSALRATFNSVDRVGDFHVFDIAGNHVRIVAAIHFNKQRLYIRHVFTHAQYDRWRPR